MSTNETLPIRCITRTGMYYDLFGEVNPSPAAIERRNKEYQHNQDIFPRLECIVRQGKSAIYNNWRAACPQLTESAFLDALKWLKEDPFVFNSEETYRMTREIGLTPDGIVKLTREYDGSGDFACFLYLDRYNRWGMREGWEGASFRVTPDSQFWRKEYEYFMIDGAVSFMQKISLSCRDRI